MTSRIATLFTSHPATVNETYFGHMRFAAWFSAMLIGAGLAAAIHAVLPFLFEKTAGNMIRTLHGRIEKRH